MTRRMFVAALVAGCGIRPAQGQAAPPRDGVFINGVRVAAQATLRHTRGMQGVKGVFDLIVRKPFELAAEGDQVRIVVRHRGKVAVAAEGFLKAIFMDARRPQSRVNLLVIVNEFLNVNEVALWTSKNSSSDSARSAAARGGREESASMSGLQHPTRRSGHGTAARRGPCRPRSPERIGPFSGPNRPALHICTQSEGCPVLAACKPKPLRYYLLMATETNKENTMARTLIVRAEFAVIVPDDDMTSESIIAESLQQGLSAAINEIAAGTFGDEPAAGYGVAVREANPVRWEN